VDKDELIRAYPTLHHMAEHGSWPGIRTLGLLSTSALLDLFEVDGNPRYEIESQWRRQDVRIRHPGFGEAVIRDQRPLNAGVENFIDGMTRSEYYKLLNGKTFFWVTRKRLIDFANARAYDGRKHDVLFIDSKGLVEKYQNEITLSPINSGAFFGSGRRGAGTFKRICDYPYEERVRKKGEDAVVELAVEYAVRDVSRFVVRVEEWAGTSPIRTIWEGPKS
jgi:hypothetical protein